MNAIDAVSGNIVPMEIRGYLRRARSVYGSRMDAVDKLRAEYWRNMERKLRADSGPGARDGFHLARDLEYIHAKVLEEQRPVPNALSLFPIDTSVPVGARTHTMRRTYEQGAAELFRGGNTGIPRVGVSQDEETWPIWSIVTSFELDIFTQQSSDYAGSQLYARHLRASRRAIEEKINRIAWYGAPEARLQGVLTYKWLAKSLSAFEYHRRTTATTLQIHDDLHAAANYPSEQSKSVFAPNAMVTSPRVRNFLMTTRLSVDNDKTIGQAFLETNAHITSIEEAWECQGVGPTSDHDAILFYRRDVESVSLIMPQPYTTLPVQREGFSDIVFAFSDFGGATMPDVGNNHLLWVKAI